MLLQLISSHLDKQNYLKYDNIIVNLNIKSSYQKLSLIFINKHKIAFGNFDYK